MAEEGYRSPTVTTVVAGMARVLRRRCRLPILRTSVGLGQWQAELFINNLLDEMAEVGCCRPFWGPAVIRPRTIGVRGNWWFD